MRRLGLVLMLVAVLLGLAPAYAPAPAGAQTNTPILDQAVAGLQRDSVFIHPDAELKPTLAEADRLRREIRKGKKSVFVAVLPGSVVTEAGGNANLVPQALYRKLGYAGTYATVAGRSFRAGSNELGPGEAGSKATNAFRDHQEDGIGVVLLAFVQDVQGKDGGVPMWLVVVILGGLAAVVLFAVSQRSRQRRAAAKGLESARRLVKADLAVLSDDVLSLEPVVTLHPDARDEYEEAVTRFRFASEAVDRVQTEEDLDRVRRVVVEGNYAMARARAVIDGRPVPPPPDELAAPGRRGEPPVELDDEDDGRVRYGGGFGGGWYGGGGWFGGSGGFLTGLLLGDMFSGGGRHHDHDPGGDVDGGDFGGGDFGGGDVGGGDFGGGGDVGGGDF